MPFHASREILVLLEKLLWQVDSSEKTNLWMCYEDQSATALQETE